MELLSLGGVLDAAVVEWALEEAGPGLAFAPLVGEVGLAPTWGGNPPPATVAAMGAGMVGGQRNKASTSLLQSSVFGRVSLNCRSSFAMERLFRVGWPGEVCLGFN